MPSQLVPVSSVYKRGPKGWRGRSESCQTGSVHRLVPAGTKSRVRRRAQHGRGGSVSRRDHNQAYRRRAHLSGGTTYAEATNPNASRSSGERGLGGEGLLSEKPPLPPESPVTPRLFGEGARGRGASLQRSSPPSQLTMEINSALIVLDCTCRCSSLGSCRGLRRRGRGKHQCARDRDAPPRPIPSAPAADGDPA